MRQFKWILTGLFALAAGCTSSRESTLNAEGPQGVFRQFNASDVGATEYRVYQPDKLKVTAPAIKELDQLTTQVRSDGKISVNLLGEVFVANKTPEEISKLLTELATKYYNTPEIRVEVVEYASKSYTVFGVAVHSQGKKPFTGRDSVIKALAEAGFSDGAWPQQVAVSRPGRPGQEKATAIIDMKNMYMTGDMRQNYLLEENDIIHVPDSPLESWGKVTGKIFTPINGATGTVSGAQSVGPTGNR